MTFVEILHRLEDKRTWIYFLYCSFKHSKWWRHKLFNAN